MEIEERVGGRFVKVLFVWEGLKKRMVWMS